jgi:HK97 gp10 family phage protein
MAATRFAGTPGIAGYRGSARFTWRGAAVVNALDDAVQDAMQRTAIEAKTEAQALAPFRTGLLRSSVFADVDARGGTGRRTLTLGADAPYAAYVILGTSRQQAQDFIRPVIDRIAPKLTERLRAAIRGIR